MGFILNNWYEALKQHNHSVCDVNYIDFQAAYQNLMFL